jgi:anti-anti-sigma factor
MKTIVDKANKRAVIRMPKKMLHEESGDLSKTIGDLARDGVKEIVLDMARTVLVDSASLGVMIFSRKAFAADGVEMVIANAEGYVKALIENAGLAKLFKIVSYREEP